MVQYDCSETFFFKKCKILPTIRVSLKFAFINERKIFLVIELYHYTAANKAVNNSI